MEYMIVNADDEWAVKRRPKPGWFCQSEWKFLDIRSGGRFWWDKKSEYFNDCWTTDAALARKWLKKVQS